MESFSRGVVMDDACFRVTVDRIWLILLQVLSEVWILFQSLFTAPYTEATLVPTLEQLVPLPHPNPVLVWDAWHDTALFSSLFISFHLFSSLFISFHLFSSLFISFHLFSSLFISFHLFLLVRCGRSYWYGQVPLVPRLWSGI